MKVTRTFMPLVLALSASLLFPGCVKKLAMKAVAGALSADGGTVFTGDNDPQLVADALPFALKTYESLLAGMPNDAQLNYATGKSFAMYAYAFIASPADTVSDDRMDYRDAQNQRAKKMYLRGRGYLLKSLEIKHPGFNSLLAAGKLDAAMALTTKADTSLLYWTGMSWMGAFIADKFDIGMVVDLNRPQAMIDRAYALNPTFGAGALDDYYISFYGAMPKSMGGDKMKARAHFKRALELAKGSRLGPYVSLASAVCVAEQNREEFEQLLDTALAIDVEAYPENRLVNTMTRAKAQWMRAHEDLWFVDASDNESGDDSEEQDTPADSSDTTAPADTLE